MARCAGEVAVYTHAGIEANLNGEWRMASGELMGAGFKK